MGRNRHWAVLSTEAVCWHERMSPRAQCRDSDITPVHLSVLVTTARFPLLD